MGGTASQGAPREGHIAAMSQAVAEIEHKKFIHASGQAAALVVLRLRALLRVRLRRNNAAVTRAEARQPAEIRLRSGSCSGRGEIRLRSG